MNKLMTDLGENYEYIRVILQNQLELKKLDLIEDISRWSGLAVIAIVGLILAFLFVITSSIILLYILTYVFGSLLWALVAFLGILLAVGILMIGFRKSLIIDPTTRLFYSFIKNRI